jgi:hypothetical protein
MPNNTRAGWKPALAVGARGLLLVAWLLLTHAVQAQDLEPVALLRLQIEDDRQLRGFASLGLPVYLRYWGSDGAQYLLVEGDPDAQAQIETLGIPYSSLDPDAQGAAYFLVYTPHALEPALLPESARVLETTPEFRLLRAGPQEMLALSQSGFEVQRLVTHPMVLETGQPASQISAAITPDPAIQAMINQVSATTASDYVGGLSGVHPVSVNDNPYTFYTRYTWAEIPIKRATRYVYEQFINLGLTAYYDTYFLSGVELRHVIAEQPGKTDPDCIILLTAHLDSTSTDPYNNAPGADDNASGSSGVLLAASILHQYDFACTLRYALFTGEEQVVTYGYFGSKFYADEVKARGENIIAVINLDMIGYNNDIYEIIELHARPDHPAEVAIANLFKNVVSVYDINLTPQIITQNVLYWSDHVSFWNVGYPAILAMEDYQELTPFYHSTNDRLSTLNTTYLRDFIRATVGTLAHLAGYIPPEPPTEDLYFPLIIKSE